MIKERIILAFVAIIAGLAIASSVFYFYQQNKSGEEPAAPSPSTSAPNGKTILEIETPEPFSVTDKKTIEVKGKTVPHALIVLTTNTEDFVLEARDDGSFAKQILLGENENVLTITSYPENETSKTKELIVTYTTEEF